MILHYHAKFMKLSQTCLSSTKKANKSAHTEENSQKSHKIFDPRNMIRVIILTVYFAAAVIHGQGQLPVKTPPVIIHSTTDECLSHHSRQVSLNYVQNVRNEIIHQISGSIFQNNLHCGPGEWRRVFYLNTSGCDQSCPGQWNLVTCPVRGCTGADISCRSAFSDNINTAYRKVCGRISGHSAETPDASARFISGQDTIEGNYLEGISVTHGVPGSRTHIWSFGAGHGGTARCPCENSDRSFAPLPLAEVGDNYFCDRADGLDPLWTGESCTNNNPCCSFHNPPYFSVQLPAATTDRIELRICTDENFANEPIVVLLAELYVQ